MKNKFKRRIVTIATALTVFASMFSFGALHSFAGETTTYIDAAGVSKSVEAEVIDASTKSLGTDLTESWYVVKGTVSVSGEWSGAPEANEEVYLPVYGNVNLILADGATLTVENGIVIPAGSTLTVYGQNSQTGKLYIPGQIHKYRNAIRIYNEASASAKLIVNGGNLDLTGAYNKCAAIGNKNLNKNYGSVYVNNGNVELKGAGNIALWAPLFQNGGVIKVTNNDPTITVASLVRGGTTLTGGTYEIVGQVAIENHYIINNLSTKGIKMIAGTSKTDSTVIKYNDRTTLGLGKAYVRFEPCTEPDYNSESVCELCNDRAAPEASVDAGTYTQNQNITLTSPVVEGKIYYTTDGTDPKTSRTAQEYTAPVLISGINGQSISTTVKAYVKAEDGGSDGHITEFVYTINLPAIQDPSADSDDSDNEMTSDEKIKAEETKTEAAETGDSNLLIICLAVMLCSLLGCGYSLLRTKIARKNN